MNQIKRLSLRKYTCGNSSERRQFSRELLSVLKESGFFILIDHDLNNQLVSYSLSVTKEFFSLPSNVKNSYQIPEAMGQRGYTGFGADQTIKDNAPDLKEYWQLGRDFFVLEKNVPLPLQNIYPKEVSEFRPVLLKLFAEVEKLGKTLLAALGEALGTPENYFEELTVDGNCVLRCLHYPAMAGLVGSESSIYRAAPHKDINFFTFLIGETNSGLQFEDNSGSWLDVKARPGEIIVDSGEMLSLITNNEIRATTHKVIKPGDDESDRYSMVFLVHPRPDAELVCINSYRRPNEKYTPVSAHNYLMDRIKYWRQAFDRQNSQHSAEEYPEY